ncbi:MAG TPA: choice-of-anchor Q domain-containing protein [Chiayiivirga sp.]|nr:choice-of-anchor Q domain-containing protein [Chiayiivirga sp.]
MRKLLLLLVLTSPVGHADTFLVSNTQDAGTGSLRQAILDLNSAAQPAIHEIVFSTAYPNEGVILLQSSLPTINGHMSTIDGNDRKPVIDGGNKQILRVSATLIQLKLQGLHLRNGRSLNGQGGCLQRTTALGTASLYLYGTQFEACKAVGTNTDATGGAVHWVAPSSTIFIRDSHFSANAVAVTSSSGSFVMGGAAIWLLGSNLQISNSHFEGNEVERLSGQARGVGGAAYLRTNHIAYLDRTQFSNNRIVSPNATTTMGGAAVIECLDSDCTGSLRDSSFVGNSISNNSQVSYGAGLVISNVALSAVNSSFSGNTIAQGIGGALIVLAGSLDARHLSFNENHAAFGSNLFVTEAEIKRWAWTLMGPVASSAGAACELIDITLTGATTGNVFAESCDQLSATGAVIGAPGPLQLDSSQLPAMLVPGPGSLAIDIGGDTHQALPVDARGMARPQDGNGDGVGFIDAGAIEVKFLHPSIFSNGFEANPPD